MPIGRYFIFVGSALLALLLAANWYFADGAAASSAAPVEYSPKTPLQMNIRIHSDRKWPEKLIFDTNQPLITAISSPKPIAPPPAPDMVMKESLQAFAQFRPAAPLAHGSAPRRKRGAIKFR